MDHGFQLALDDFLGLPRLALCQRFAHTDDGRDALGQRSLRLQGHHGIGFTMVLATLRVPDQGVAHVKILEHGSRKLARVGARVMLRHILRSHANGRPCKLGLGLGQIGGRHSHRHTRISTFGQPLLEGLEQHGIGSQAAIHLPVADDEFLLHGYHVKTILPVC